MNWGNTVYGNDLLVETLVVFFFVLGVHLGCVRELVQEDVLATAEAKLDNVFFFELIIALGFYALVVQVGAVAGTQVDDVRPYPAAKGSVCTRKLHQSAEVHREK